MSNGKISAEESAGKPSTLGSRLTTGDFLGALEDAVRENPLPAALIGMGVLWMFTGGTDTRLFGARGAKSLLGATLDRAGDIGQSVGDAINTVGSSLSAAAGNAADTTKTLGSAAAHTVHNIGDTAGKSTQSAMSNTAHYVQDSGAKWGSALQQNMGELLEKQPLVLGLLGIAIGAGIAASLPTTEAEQKLMGEASDFVQEQVSTAAVQIKEIANAAVEEARAQL